MPMPTQPEQQMQALLQPEMPGLAQALTLRRARRAKRVV